MEGGADNPIQVSNPKKGHLMEGERQSRISRYVQETGVDIKYGEKTWRPVQSVIDLVQNHLDANTTVYEKGLLRLAGTTDYDPSSKEQQEAVSLLNKIKYSDRPEDIDKTYSMLMGVLGPNTPPRESLQQQLQELNYPLPHVRLKVSNGTQSQLVEYDQVKDLPPEWQVAGFRIDDTGSGFDHRLLGMMGASTKKESTGKRGGLGEGLKMSVTHLARSGATVRLLSRNEDQLWIAKPKVQDGTVMFEGVRREDAEPKVTGSLTDVDFSGPNFDPKLRTEIADALDPRKGEGLGKYILEFRDPQFAAVINSSTEVSSRNVPGGRVYVKGLLVEEPDNLLWSYNLKEKWAIGGRDRKTVQRDVLTGNIRGVIETIDNPEQVDSLVGALAAKKNYLEVQALDGDLHLGEDQKELWKQSVEQTFHFSPGQQLFASDRLSSDQRRLAEQRGFKIISLPPESMKAVALLETLYPDQMVSFAQFQRNRGAEASPVDPVGAAANIDILGGLREEIQIKEHPVSPEVAEVLDRYKNEFTLMLTGTVLKQFERGYGIPAQLKRLQGVKFAQANGGTYFESDSPFEYNAAKNTLYVREGAVKADFATLTDMYVQLIKAATGRDTFEGQSQALLTQMAAETVASLRPELLTEFRLSGSNGRTAFERPITYPTDQHTKDDELVAFFRHFELVNTPNITKEELERVLGDMRAAKPADLSGGKPHEAVYARNDIPRDQINSLFYFDGKLYSLNTYSFQLQEVNFGGESQPKRALGGLDLDTKKLFGADYTKLFGDLLGKSPKITPSDEQIRPKRDSDLFFPSTFRLGRESDYKGPERKLLNPGESSYQLNGKEWAYLPFQLHDRESMRFSFSEGDKEAQVVLKRRGNRIVATKVVDGKAELLKRGKAAYFYEQFGGSGIEVYNNVLLIRPSESGSVTIDRNEFRAAEQLEEVNKGKEFISSNITLDYGGEVWRDPKRILLDAIQNHIDARRDQVPDVSYTVVGTDGKVLRVSKDELQNIGNEWNIVGIGVADQGEGYPTPYLTKLGSSTKGDEDLGKFGEGLKMLAASAVRQGIKVEIGSRDWVAEPTGYQQTVKDYETGRDRAFNMLGYNMRWQDQPQVGSRTSFSLLSLDPGQQQLTPEQMTQLQATLNEGAATGKVWQEWTEVLDPRQVNQFGQRGLDRYVLPEEGQTHTDGVVNLLMDNTGRVYEKGLLIPGDISQPMMFGYNLDETIIDTRERNAFNQKILDSYIADYFKNLTDTEVMRRVLEMAKQKPGVDFYEYKFMSFGTDKASQITEALWRQTYHEVFGDDAVLSLRPELQRLDRHLYARQDRGTFGKSSFGRDEGANRYRADIAHAVANEAHLENQNLQMLPEPLTNFFSSEVYTSKDFSKELESAEVELPPEDKEKLTRFVQTANQMVLTVLESLDFNPDRRQYLTRVVSPEHLHTRKEHLQRMLSENVRIKNPSFPALGMVEEQDGQAVVYLNQNILSDPNQLLDTYVHEVSHYLSGQGDYVIGFQRFLMAMAANRSVRPNY